MPDDIVSKFAGVVDSSPSVTQVVVVVPATPVGFIDALMGAETGTRMLMDEGFAGCEVVAATKLGNCPNKCCSHIQLLIEAPGEVTATAVKDCFEQELKKYERK